MDHRVDYEPGPGDLTIAITETRGQISANKNIVDFNRLEITTFDGAHNTAIQ
jgi:hypothetical protein